MVHFVAGTTEYGSGWYYKGLKGVDNDLSHTHKHTHLSAGLLMFSCQIVETGRGCVDLSLQGESQGLVVLPGDHALLCGLLGLQLSQLHLLLTQSLLSRCQAALTGLQGALELCLRDTKHKYQTYRSSVSLCFA